MQYVVALMVAAMSCDERTKRLTRIVRWPALALALVAGVVMVAAITTP